LVWGSVVLAAASAAAGGLTEVAGKEESDVGRKGFVAR
jgi:hypothetical protein